MDTVDIRIFKIYQGPPDLTVRVVPAKTWIYGGPLVGVPQDSSLVTVTVQNRFSFPPPPPGPVVADNTIPVFGSDAKGVLVSVSLTFGLQQVGGMILPPGFQAAVAPDRKGHRRHGFHGQQRLRRGIHQDHVGDLVVLHPWVREHSHQARRHVSKD
jgi:hypothetical protein